MKDLAWLIIRLTTGGLLAGHGAQKLFGWFGGVGLARTAGWLDSMGLRPARWWAAIAGLGEFAGGALTALGLFHPFGPLLIFGPMAVATGKVHWGKPIWAEQGGAELPVMNMSSALALLLAGPGRFSLDRLVGIRVPRVLVLLWAVAILWGAALAVSQKPVPVAETVGMEETGTERKAA